jgi:hypothetical protein
MSNLIRMMEEFKADGKSVRDMYHTVLCKRPYCLRYSLDSKRPDLFMIFAKNSLASDTQNPVVRDCNGVVIDSEFNVVCMGSRLVTDATKDTEVTGAGFFAEVSVDGTMLKIWWYARNEEWMVSTNRRIDASRVRWSSDKTFHQLMCEVLPGPLDSLSLDKDCVYTIILLHPEIQHVIEYVEPTLVFVSQRNKKSGFESRKNTHPHLWTSGRFDGDSRGMLYSDWTNPQSVERYKVDHDWFESAANVRKNMPTMTLSYIACDILERNSLREWFPKHIDTFHKTGDALYYLACAIFKVYKKSFVGKEYRVGNDDLFFRALTRLHRRYKKSHQSIVLSDVGQVLRELSPYYVHTLLMNIALID